MNDTLRTIDERRSTRQYLDKEISKEHKEIILNAAINAPTAGNMLLYSIIDVTDQDKKEKLSVLCDNQPFIKNGSMVLVFVANSKKWYDVYIEPPMSKDIRFLLQRTTNEILSTSVTSDSSYPRYILLFNYDFVHNVRYLKMHYNLYLSLKNNMDIDIF